MTGAEKDTMRAQLAEWFGDRGIPQALTRGYSSQSFVNEVADYAAVDDRPAVLIYTGDFDVDGFDIMEDFERRTGMKVIRIAVNFDQIEAYDLATIAPKRSYNDPRRRAFRDRFGGFDRSRSRPWRRPPCDRCTRRRWPTSGTRAPTPRARARGRGPEPPGLTPHHGAGGIASWDD
jgi:hypothetical protein